MVNPEYRLNTEGFATVEPSEEINRSKATRPLIDTRQKLRELGWNVLMHQPYSPDQAPRDYHYHFLSTENDFNGEKLVPIEAYENRLSLAFCQ